jgi:hypothetical protein
VIKVYQLLAHGQWFSPGIPASSTTKTGHLDIAGILLKVALNNKINEKINPSQKNTSLNIVTEHLTHFHHYMYIRSRLLSHHHIHVKSLSVIKKKKYQIYAI